MVFLTGGGTTGKVDGSGKEGDGKLSTELKPSFWAETVINDGWSADGESGSSVAGIKSKSDSVAVGKGEVATNVWLTWRLIDWQKMLTACLLSKNKILGKWRKKSESDLFSQEKLLKSRTVWEL